MARAITPDRIIEYVLEEDRELSQDEQTVWLLKPLTVNQIQQIEKRTTKYDKRTNEATVGTTHMFMDAVRRGLVGFRNLLDEDGNEVEFVAKGGINEGQINDETFNRIRHAHRMEIGGVLLEQNHVSDEEGKP